MPEIVATVRSRKAVVVVAPPGAGKTTRIPPALCADGPVILLQPRRVAARALARRIAEEKGWVLGEEVGWQVRFERRFSDRTRLLVATEGILTARLQADPLLSGFATVVVDEFHERSMHGDLALAFAKQAAAARDDLRLVVMSATLDAAAVAAFLGGCPVVEVTARVHPVDVGYAPGLAMAEAVRQIVSRDGGHVLAFLPGAPEIRRVQAGLGDLPSRGIDVRPLYGSLDADAQDAALAPASRKVILATNVAETSLTVDGVTDVVDSGLQKVLRYEADKGIDRLETERISEASAAQRAGRAGRTGPGRALRLWDPRERLRPHREPEIERVDLLGPLLDVIAWGADPLSFGWFEAPPQEAMESALVNLERLRAVMRDSHRALTPVGEQMRRLPLPPRLARVLVAASGSRLAVAVCAALAERLPSRVSHAASTSDALALADAVPSAAPSVRQAVRELAAVAERVVPGAPGPDDEGELRRALLAGYPDRVARRREPGSPRLLLSSGHGAVLARESGVRDGEFVVALDLAAGERGPGSEALVRLASRVEREWLEPTHRGVEHRFDDASGAVRAVEVDWYDRLRLTERPVDPDRGEAAALLVRELKARGLGLENEAVLRRLRFAGIEADLDGLIEQACAGETRLPQVDVKAGLPFATARDLDRLAPERLRVPSGRSLPLDYREDGTVVLPVKLQEMFGLADTPRLGPRNEPVTLSLLSPGGRPVQTTRDLRSFWERTYPEVRKELRARYPRHPWPEDPWSATPTARTQRRQGR